MINDELLSKLDSIEDLPISEEMLGAYLQGNLDFYESNNIESSLSSDEQLFDFANSINYDDLTILDNLDHKIIDPTCSFPLSDIQIPDLSPEAIGNGFLEEQFEPSPCDFYGLVDTVLDVSEDVLSSNFEENFLQSDSFLDQDQSLDVDSSEGDDMFNDDLTEL